jgi:glycosyltransferase involved in cell wall biosynthesis
MTDATPQRRISVLIPIFNWEVGRLVDALAREIVAESLEDTVDVHLYDDASNESYLWRNREHVTRAQSAGLAVTLHGTLVNGGRSAARNALIEVATGRHLLFLDADVLPDTPNFLSQYLLAADEADADAVCGGISYWQCTDAPKRARFYLRYSQAASVAPASVRMRNPWAWVYTANVLVSRNVIDRVPFDQGFVGYGYEDLEWGLRLSKTGRLLHIENPVTHFGLLTKATLAVNTAEAARNLVHLWRLHPAEAQRMRLVQLARRMAALPVPVLGFAAWLARVLFMQLGGPYTLELALFHADKVMRTALAFRHAPGVPRDGG